MAGLNQFTNNAATTLASGINASVTSLSVASGTGTLFPTLAGSNYFYCTLANNAGTVEIVKVTARSTDTFTIVRGQDNRFFSSQVELDPLACQRPRQLDKRHALTNDAPRHHAVRSLRPKANFVVFCISYKEILSRAVDADVVGIIELVGSHARRALAFNASIPTDCGHH